MSAELEKSMADAGYSTGRRLITEGLRAARNGDGHMYLVGARAARRADRLRAAGQIEAADRLMAAARQVGVEGRRSIKKGLPSYLRSIQPGVMAAPKRKVRVGDLGRKDYPELRIKAHAAGRAAGRLESERQGALRRIAVPTTGNRADQKAWLARTQDEMTRLDGQRQLVQETAGRGQVARELSRRVTKEAPMSDYLIRKAHEQLDELEVLLGVEKARGRGAKRAETNASRAAAGGAPKVPTGSGGVQGRLVSVGYNPSGNSLFDRYVRARAGVRPPTKLGLKGGLALGATAAAAGGAAELHSRRRKAS